MSYQLFSVGDNVADYYIDRKLISAGGSALNVAVVARRLGVESAYHGIFGSDEAGDFLKETLRNEKVDCPVCVTRNGMNAIAKIRELDSVTKIDEVDKGVYKNLQLNSSDMGEICSAKLVHTTVYSYVERYLPRIKRETNVSFDFSFYRELKYLERVLECVDFAFFTKTGGEDVRNFLSWASEKGPQLTIMLMGSEGSLLYYKGVFYHQSALPINVVDSLGAGDAYIAAFLTELINNKIFAGKEISVKIIDKIMQRATKTAAEYCQLVGSLGIHKGVDYD